MVNGTTAHLSVSDRLKNIKTDGIARTILEKKKERKKEYKEPLMQSIKYAAKVVLI